MHRGAKKMDFDDLDSEFHDGDEEDDFHFIYKNIDDLFLAFNLYDEEYIVYHELKISDGESKEEYFVKVFQSKELSDCVEFINKFYEIEIDEDKYYD